MSDIEVHFGRTKTFEILVEDDAGPIDLSGKEIRFSAKYSYRNTAPQVLITEEANGIVPDPDQDTNKGKAVVKIEPEDLDHLDGTRVNVLVYEILMKEGNDPFLIEKGRLIVHPSVDVLPA